MNQANEAEWLAPGDLLADSATLALAEPLARPSPLSQMVLIAGGQGGLAICGFVTGTIAARLLGPAARGQLAAIQLAASLLATFATLGLSESVLLFCARERDKAGRYLMSAMLLALVVAVPMLLLSYLAMPYLLAAQAPAIIHAARWYLLIALFYILWGFPNAALRGIGEFAIWNVFRFVTPAASIAALWYAWWTGYLDPGFIALLTLALLILLGVLSSLFAIPRWIPGPFIPNMHWWRPMIAFGVPSVASVLPKNLNLRLDQMLMAAVLPPRLLGLYVVAAAWSTMTSPLLDSVAVFLFPHVASQKPGKEQTGALVQVTRLATPVAAIQVIAFAIITPWGLPLIFGHAYRASVPSALVLVVAGATLYLGQLLEEGLRGLGSPMPILWAELGGLVVTAIALLCLLKPMGIMGGAISSMLGYATVWTLLLVQTRSLTGISIAKIVLPTGSDLRDGWTRIRRMAW